MSSARLLQRRDVLRAPRGRGREARQPCWSLGGVMPAAATLMLGAGARSVGACTTMCGFQSCTKLLGKCDECLLDNMAGAYYMLLSPCLLWLEGGGRPAA
jgi:hypothetical protein